MNIFQSIIAFFKALWNKWFGKPPNFVMIGDSIIQNMTATQPSLPEPFKTALNLGIGGQTTTQIRARISSIPAGTKTVLLEGGANNLSLGGDGTIVEDYVGMLSAIPLTTRVIVIGMIRMDETILPTINAKIDAINTLINAAAVQRPNTVVATGAQTVSMVGLTIDGTHPSPAGYAALVTALFPVL